ncbi:ribosomal RNA small subunit methyltransferase A [Leptospira ryugenii]|uniref:Ribosomal RNA small subunit methyltransferase A n=1 Tax=Leptospira ryugenii TaxID=1917863 RepID=A0A2P2DVA7_9LEPT|nr:ribosomal RNA small subunit methyltransferase A [Leptospira ryugenii]
MAANGWNAQKKFGQNFLIDPPSIQFIIQSSVPYIEAPEIEIAEIGIGLGSLTYPILQLNRKSHLFEIDTAYIQIAEREILPKFQQSILYPGDALSRLIEIKDLPIFLFGNLPYHLTSDILTLIATEFSRWRGGIFMVQKEFAIRVCEEISSLSLFLDAIVETKLLKHIHKNCFYPIPKIDSSLIRLVPKQLQERMFRSKDEIELYSRFLRTVFWGKRKQMSVSLRESPFSQDRDFQEAVLKAFSNLGISGKKRPEELNREQFLNLGQELLDALSK